MTQTCPMCRTINEPHVTRCECGWDFAAAKTDLSRALPAYKLPEIASKARASWVCPLAAWVSQILLTVALRGVSGLGFVWLAAALFQVALIIAGLYLAGKVLSFGRSVLPPSTYRQACTGMALSAGTVLLIVILTILNPR